VQPKSELDDEGTLVVEQYFAILPEWIIDADISDAAVRLYSVLLRYGQSSGHRMPSRALLARRLHKRSTDSVDRALKELVACGAVIVERRRRGPEFLSNRYHLRNTPPPSPAADSGRNGVAAPPSSGGSRKFAATPSRTDAATLAARMRPYPESSTQRRPPPSAPISLTPAFEADGRGGGADRTSRLPVVQRTAQLLAALGLRDLDGVVERCCEARRSRGLPTGRWTARVLIDVLAGAVLDDGWPATVAVPALVQLAADPVTRSPARLRCAGPWWDVANPSRSSLSAAEAAELAALEAVLAESDGARVLVQREARRQLTAEQTPLTRLTVARRAASLLPQTPRSAAC